MFKNILIATVLTVSANSANNSVSYRTSPICKILEKDKANKARYERICRIKKDNNKIIGCNVEEPCEAPSVIFKGTK